jgi:hypothetical protein
MADLSTIEVRSPQTEVTLAPASPSDRPIQFEYAVVTSSGRGGWLHGVAIDEGGAVRWCGYAQPHVDDTHGRMDDEIDSIGRPPRDLAALLPTSGPPGQEQVDDRALTEPPTGPPGWTSGWTRAWADPEYGGSGASATRFSSPALAESALRARMDEFAADVVDSFEVSRRPQVIGLRVAAVAWTWLQSAETGYQCDYAFALADDTIVEVSACGLAPDDAHTQALALVDGLAFE